MADQVETETPKIMTRSRERKRKIDEGIVDPPPPPKYQTLGQYLMEEREKETNQLLEKPLIDGYEQFEVYNKNAVVEAFQATKVEKFRGQLFETGETHDQMKIVFITLQTGENPKTFTHLCNHTSLVWNIKDLNVSSREHTFNVPSVVMLFVRGKYIPGTSLEGNEYKYLGLIGIQSLSSDGSTYNEVKFVFDYVLSRKEIDTHFGENCIRCKKNKYGSALCGWKSGW